MTITTSCRRFWTKLGFKSCTFSYPLTTLASSYLSFSDSSLVSYKTEELIQVFEKIKQMKKRSGFPVVNPTESLNEMQRHLRKEPEKFGCLGGHKYFYLDWNLNLYRCHFWETPMCNIYEFDESKLIRDGCTRCMIDCYRDPSVLQFVAISASDALQQCQKRQSHCRRQKYFRPAQSDFAQGRLGRPQMDWRSVRWSGCPPFFGNAGFLVRLLFRRRECSRCFQTTATRWQES